MITINTTQLKEILGIQNPLNIKITGVSHDSRNTQPGNLFIPLKGETVDGHTFILNAFEKGAAASFCDQENYDTNTDLQGYKNQLIVVADPKKAYFDLMRWWKQQFPHVVTIGIGGSTGKTTTKELMRRVCEADGKTIYTEGNLNTTLGMCIIVDKLETDTKYMVCEMGTDTFGEITEEAYITQPEYGVSLSVSPTHAQWLGGTIDGVAKAESELVQYLGDKKLVVLHKDDPYIWVMKKYVSTAKLRTFGHKDTDAYMEKYSMSRKGMDIDLNILKNIQVPTWGEGNIGNVMAVVLIAQEIGISDEKILQGLRNYTPVHGRLNFFDLKDHMLMIDDAYNANPHSMKQGIDVFTHLYENEQGEKGRKVFFLGDMRELGEHAPQCHEDLAEIIRKAQPDMLFYVGDFREMMAEKLEDTVTMIQIFPNVDYGDAYHIRNKAEIEQVFHMVSSQLKPRDWILCKGSLGTGVWKVVEEIKEQLVA